MEARRLLERAELAFRRDRRASRQSEAVQAATAARVAEMAHELYEGLKEAVAELEALRNVAALGPRVAALSVWVDASYPDDMEDELHLRRRIDKVGVEYGEVGEALEGFTGENPRKGVFRTREDVMKELLDTAHAALGAWEHMDGNKGRSGAALAAQAGAVLVRVGQAVD